MDSYFVGSKSSPEFLVELRKKKTKYDNLTIYKPDKYSKNEEFYEKYALGKVVFTAKNAEIIGGKRYSVQMTLSFAEDISQSHIMWRNQSYCNRLSCQCRQNRRIWEVFLEHL